MFENTHTIFGGRNVYGGRGEFHGGDIEVFRGGDRGFFWGGGKVLRGKKTRVPSPESRERLENYIDTNCKYVYLYGGPYGGPQLSRQNHFRRGKIILR